MLHSLCSNCGPGIVRNGRPRVTSCALFPGCLSEGRFHCIVLISSGASGEKGRRRKRNSEIVPEYLSSSLSHKISLFMQLGLDAFNGVINLFWCAKGFSEMSRRKNLYGAIAPSRRGCVFLSFGLTVGGGGGGKRW